MKIKVVTKQKSIDLISLETGSFHGRRGAGQMRQVEIDLHADGWKKISADTWEKPLPKLTAHTKKLLAIYIPHENWRVNEDGIVMCKRKRGKEWSFGSVDQLNRLFADRTEKQAREFCEELDGIAKI